jgi:hypothetical protein
MNFNASPDAYHLFLARFNGFILLVQAYCIYDNLYTDPTKVTAITMGGIALLGPTYAALYLSPKQTMAGHLPAHFIMLLAGVLAATS